MGRSSLEFLIFPICTAFFLRLLRHSLTQSSVLYDSNQCGEDVWDAWRALREHTDAFHLKDSDNKGHHTPLGRGNGNCQQIISDAVSRGWTGPVTLEPHLQNTPAVLATVEDGAGLNANVELSSLSAHQVWQVAAEAAKEVLGKAGASWY